MGIYEELEWRGLIKDVSDPSIRENVEWYDTRNFDRYLWIEKVHG